MNYDANMFMKLGEQEHIMFDGAALFGDPSQNKGFKFIVRMIKDHPRRGMKFSIDLLDSSAKEHLRRIQIKRANQDDDSFPSWVDENPDFVDGYWMMYMLTAMIEENVMHYSVKHIIEKNLSYICYIEKKANELFNERNKYELNKAYTEEEEVNKC